MPSTANTIHEKWPLSETEKKRPGNSRVFHFAIKQDGVSLDFHLEQFFRNQQVSFHFFDDFETLITICQRFPVGAIIMAGKGTFIRELELLRWIRQNAFLTIIPVVLYHPNPDNTVILAAYEHLADDFIHGEWQDRIIEARIRRLIERSRHDLSINPSTLLPGPNLIEEVIQSQLDMQAEFAVCYADLDNFKAYNDYYGYSHGDRIIRLTGRIIRDCVFDLCREGFVGHIAGDDFLYVIPCDLIERTCQWILRTFDAVIPYRYAEEDRERGHITTYSRRGDIEQFPILTMSIAVIVNEDGKFKHVGELSRMLADLKKVAKAEEGSTFVLERRKKY